MESLFDDSYISLSLLKNLVRRDVFLLFGVEDIHCKRKTASELKPAGFHVR
jgi:hypothetical protein